MQWDPREGPPPMEEFSDSDLVSTLRRAVEPMKGLAGPRSDPRGIEMFLEEVQKRLQSDGLAEHCSFESIVEAMQSLKSSQLYDDNAVSNALYDHLWEHPWADFKME